MEGQLLPGETARGADPLLLRRAPRDGGDQLHLLSDAEPEDDRGLGCCHAPGLHVRPQGADTENGTTPLVATASWGYFRLRDEGYAPDDLARWVETVRRLGAAWQDAYVFFKHEESGIGPKLAQQFQQLLGQ